MERTKEKSSFRKRFIGDKKFYMMVLAVAVPIMIQNGITNFVSLLDNIMAGYPVQGFLQPSISDRRIMKVCARLSGISSGWL